MHSFGASAPLKELLGKFGFTPTRWPKPRANRLPLGVQEGKSHEFLAATRRGGPVGVAGQCQPRPDRKGELATLIKRDGLKGVTSNPSIFEKAIGGSSDYDADLIAFARSTKANAVALYEHLAVGDIQEAADVLRPVFDAAGGRDGFISLEVSPYLANDTQATVVEARRLWAAVDRPNLMVKVPGTEAGVPAIATLIGEGININVTLLFSQSSYEAVALAYVEGLERLAAAGGTWRRVPAWQASSSAASIPPSMPSSTSASSPPAARSERTWSRFAAR